MENEIQWFRVQKSYYSFKNNQIWDPEKWRGRIIAAILNGSVGVWQSHRQQAKEKLRAKTSQKWSKMA